MKMSQGKLITFILTLLILVPLFIHKNEATASAATPTMNQTSLVFEGLGEEYDLEVNDKVSGSKYKWSSTNTKVARVSSRGIVTTMGAGTATIKCKITLPSKSTKTLSCKVTVTIPASEVKINNAIEVKGAHRLSLGESFNFNRDIVPSTSSDLTYWSIGGGDADCIRIDDNTSGTVTATKVGYVVLKATAVKSLKQEDIKKSIINDAVIIEVIAPTATVKSADIVSSTEIRVVFDSPVKADTVIGANNKLLDSIEISMGWDLKGKLAKDPGELTASLSSDGKTLTVNSKEMFDGVYGINFSDKIKTTTDLSITAYYTQMKYVDEVGPQILRSVVDDTGMINTIYFSEAINFTNFKVSNAKQVSSANNMPADSTTISYLNNKLNYIISPDKKSVAINLSQIIASDYGKMFTITLTGIEDLSGNRPASYTLTTVVYSDVTPKSQARPMSAIRTGYDKLTITFDRAIRSPGMASVNNGIMMYGVVDDKDSKKVNFTLYEMDAILNGPQTVSVGYWDSYNVNPADTTAQQMFSFSNVIFTTEKTLPFLIGHEFDSETNILTLSYTEEVTTAYTSGIFISRLLTSGDEIIPDTSITYSKLDSTDKKQIKLLLGNLTLAGEYLFRLEQGFAIDNFKNQSAAGQLTISNAGGSLSQLPPPYLINQSTTNPSQIYLEFANMLDVASAMNISNYSIAGVQIISAEVTRNQKGAGATVMLTVADGSIDITVERPVTVKGVMGYGGALSAMEPYTSYVELKDNKKPYYTGQITFDRNTRSTVRMEFSEEITGTMIVRVTQITSTYPIEYASTVTVSGSSVIINLSGIPQQNTYLRIDVLENRITDLSGNQCQAMQAQLGVPATY